MFPDVCPQSTRLHVNRPRCMAGHDVPAAQDRSPLQEARFFDLFRLQYRDDYDTLATLPVRPITIAIKRSHQQVV